jgi:hypothetical protein
MVALSKFQLTRTNSSALATKSLQKWSLCEGLTALESLSQQVSFMKPRVGVYLSEGMAVRLAEAAKHPRATKSALVELGLVSAAADPSPQLGGYDALVPSSKGRVVASYQS